MYRATGGLPPAYDHATRQAAPGAGTREDTRGGEAAARRLAEGVALSDVIDAEDPRVRARAVAGLRTLDVTDVRRLRALLDDPAPGVVREATPALLPFAR